MTVVYDLTYFKPNGKYYGTGKVDLPEALLFHEVMEEIGRLARRRELPGLVKGHSKYVVHLVGPRGVPHLIIPEGD